MKLNLLQLELSVLFLCAATPYARPQGTFVNLDFESANIPPGTPPGFVAASNALPGWIGPTSILYDAVPLNDAGISIHDANDPSLPVLQGNYSVLLSPNNPVPTIFPSIAQLGTIPNNARSLQFYAAYFPTVLFGGQQLALVTLVTTPTYSIFAADISAFAGQTGELRFTGQTLLDNISFSDQAIPEPGVFGLIGLGLVALGLTRRGWGR